MKFFPVGGSSFSGGCRCVWEAAIGRRPTAMLRTSTPITRAAAMTSPAGSARPFPLCPAPTCSTPTSGETQLSLHRRPTAATRPLAPLDPKNRRQDPHPPSLRRAGRPPRAVARRSPASLRLAQRTRDTLTAERTSQHQRDLEIRRKPPSQPPERRSRDVLAPRTPRVRHAVCTYASKCAIIAV